ncbi:MAG: glycoside hydrolase family 57 protein, partial [Candidatus Saccharimonadaceae bacterium]
MSKKGVVIYLHVHQPWRIREYGVFDTGYKHDYFEAGDADADRDNGRIFRKVAEKSYIPMNALLEKMLNEQPDFKVSMSISGVFIEQAERYMPEVLESFKRIVATGQVELVAETFYHSLAFFYSREEFERQVEMHRQKIRDVFGVETQVFRNTELSYNNELGKWADQAGFKGIMTEGWDPILQWRSPNFVYQPEGTENIRLLLKNYRLSDDIAFRFGNKAWVDYPLSADKYIEWLRSSLDQTQIVNLFMDYET